MLITDKGVSHLVSMYRLFLKRWATLGVRLIKMENKNEVVTWRRLNRNLSKNYGCRRNSRQDASCGSGNGSYQKNKNRFSGKTATVERAACCIIYSQE